MAACGWKGERMRNQKAKGSPAEKVSARLLGSQRNKKSPTLALELSGWAGTCARITELALVAGTPPPRPPRVRS